MKKNDPKSCFMLYCLFFEIFSIVFLLLPINTQSEELDQDVKQIWEHNCVLREK